MTIDGEKQRDKPQRLHWLEANGTIIGELTHPGVRIPEPEGADRERHVRVFTKQLLTALGHMHTQGLAHLDLRPESILLQDDKLILADFGSSRRVDRSGHIRAAVRGSPEFVSPEVVNGQPLTLSTDIWSVGTLTYILLTGVSPFHGDNDAETLRNVSKGLYRTDTEEWKNFSQEASSFIHRLLSFEPSLRPTVRDALADPWISDGSLESMVLSADCLREFRYKHKWLERRVFVQQTPSELRLESLEAPATERCRPGTAAAPASGRFPIPFDANGRPQLPGDYPFDNKTPPSPSPGPAPIPVDQYGRFVHPEELARIQAIRGPQPQLVDQFGRPIPPEVLRRLQQQRFEEAQRGGGPRPMSVERRRLEPQQQGEAPATERFRAPEIRAAPEDAPLVQVPLRMIRGEHRPIEEEIANRILSDISEEGSLAGSVGSLEELEPYFARDYRFTPRRPRYDRSASSTPRLDENLSDDEDLSSSSTLSPKTVKESENFTPAGPLSPPAALSPGVSEKDETDKTPDPVPPVISSSSGTTPSTQKHVSPEPLLIPIIPMPDHEKENNNCVEQSVKHVNVPDHVPVEELKKYSNDILKEIDSDPKIAVGVPIFIEPLERHHPFLISPSLQVDIPLVKDGTLSPKSPKNRGRAKQKAGGGTGTKNVILSPGREHSMEVLIATKRGKPEFIAPGETVPELDDDERKNRQPETKAKPKTHSKDEDFEDRRDDLEEIKRQVQQQKKMIDDLDKYRVGNFYKDDDGFRMEEDDIDASPWDSHYQIGPDTYLMASRGAAFNSRVRDYRRELFGDGAPLVRQGFLGVRNRDITVRERRRYTDILRESQLHVAPKSADAATTHTRDPKANAVHRIKTDIEKVAPSSTTKNADGTFSPIFVGRLKDTYLVPEAPSAVFECQILAQPAPDITWTKHGHVILEDGKHKMHVENGAYRLTILQPSAFDLGEYACHAKNEHGTDQSHARLISGEAPARPGRPSLELSSDTELFMTFEPPEGPTYLEGISYKVECRLAGENDYDAPWITVNDKVEDEAVIIKNLEPMGTYQFRVTAKNGFGWGQPSLHSRIVRTHPRGGPKLQLDEISRTARFDVLTMPAGGKRFAKKKTKHHPYDGLYSNLPAASGPKSLEGISEESEETEEDSSSTHSNVPGQPDTTELQGDLGGRFELGSLIFSTKYSIVRNANDTQKEHNNRCVAKLRGADDDAKTEFETLRAVQHENVEKLLAASISSNVFHLFVERLYEDVFARFCYADHYNEEQIAIVARQTAAALHWLHFKGVAHLDINPHNVMFGSKRSWVVKLVDFSSAQFIGPNAKPPADLDVQWAAPELHIPDTPVTVQSDLWGLGVIVFCLLGGFHPFTSEFDSPEDVKENVINVKCDPNLIPVQASQDALSFVTWSLKKSPLRRIRTDEALSHRFVSAEPAAVRRREAIRYSSNRLRKTAHLTKQTFIAPRNAELQNRYGTNSR